MAVLIYSQKEKTNRIQTVFRGGINVDTENPRESTMTTVEVLRDAVRSNLPCQFTKISLVVFLQSSH